MKHTLIFLLLALVVLTQLAFGQNHGVRISYDKKRQIGDTIHYSSGDYVVISYDNVGNRVTYQVFSHCYNLPIPPVNGNLNLCPSGSTTLSTPTVPNATYSWSTGATTQSITVNNAGIYRVWVKYPDGCEKESQTVSINVSPAMAISFTTNPVLCYGGTTGTATVAVIGGTAPYTYTWNTNPVQYNATANGLGAGTYTVTVTDANNCTSTANVTITQASSSFALASSSICLNTNPVLTINGLSNATQLQWLLNGNILSTSGFSLPANAVTIAGGNGVGSGLNQLNYPADVFVDVNGDRYVSDRNNYRVLKYAPGSNVGVVVAGGNGQGNALNQLNTPWGIFVDNTGNLYVADGNAHCVKKWAPGATSGVVVAGGNGAGSGATQLNSPNAVFVDGNGYIYVSDGANYRIRRFPPNSNTGTTVAGGNGYGTNLNQLHTPMSVYVANNKIYVACYGSHRVIEWALGASAGVIIAGGNGQGGAANQLNYPTDVWVDANGDVFICDYGNSRIQKRITSTGTVITAAGSGPGNTPNKLYNPTGVCVESNGSLVVADAGNNRVQLWQSMANTTLTPTLSGAYTAVVTNSNGCVETSNVVNIYTTTTNIASQTNVICNGASTGSATAFAFGGTSPYSYTWNTSPTQYTAMATGLGAGSYGVNSVDANGCSSSQSVTITQPSPLTMTLSTAPTPNCSNCSTYTVIIGSVSGGIPPYNYSLDGGLTQEGDTFYNVMVGNHSVTLSDANNCTLSLALGSNTRQNTPKNVSIQNNFISVYPNPSKGIYALEYDLGNAESKNISYEIYNAEGKLVTYKEKIAASHIYNERIDISNETDGVYWLNIKIENEVYTKKLIKE